MKRLILILLCIFIVSEVYSQENKKLNTNIPDGYGSLTWGTNLSKARENIAGKLVFTDEKSTIISKDGHLRYQYGFFYIDPAIKAFDKGESPDAKDQPDDEGKLFYVSLKFPYLSLKEVKEKITEKYGESTNDNIIKNRGAIAWDSAKTIIIMWVDRYEKKPYCRRITYLSKEIAKELNEYNTKVFNKVELELIRKLNP